MAPRPPDARDAPAEPERPSAVRSLVGERYISLATYRKSGAEVRTPVWFAEVDGKLYVFTTGDAGKVKRLRNSPRARVAPSDARGGTKGGWREATAQVITDPVEIGHAHDALRVKYRWQMYMADVFARLLGRYRRRAWIEVDLRRTS